MAIAEPLPPGTAEKRCVFHIVSSANYRYARPARHVQTYVRLIPQHERGSQRLLEERLQVAPLPHYNLPETADRWGNRVFEVRHDQIEEHLTLIADLRVETCGYYSERDEYLPSPIAPRDAIYAERRLFREFTDRTRPSAELEHTAQEIMTGAGWAGEAHSADPFAFVTAVCQRVHDEMSFLSGSTHVGTTAAEAWANRRGVCQDFTHVALSLFRLAGVPARYVSGFVPGEGVMHAWIEVLVGPAGLNKTDSAAWYAYDPTYNKWRNEQYVTVAVGRDYADVTPVSGTYFGGASTLQYGTRVETVRLDRRAT